MKRKSMIVAMIVLAAVLIASPVLAAGSSHPMEAAKKRPTSISLTGKIVEDRGSEIRVAIRMTNRAFIQYRNTTQTIDIDNALCFKWVSETKSETLDCDEDLGEDDTVAVIARVTRTDSGNVIFTARRVQLKQPRIQIP